MRLNHSKPVISMFTNYFPSMFSTQEYIMETINISLSFDTDDDRTRWINLSRKDISSLYEWQRKDRKKETNKARTQGTDCPL